MRTSEQTGERNGTRERHWETRVAATMRMVFAQPEPEVAPQARRTVADGFRPHYPRLATLLDAAESEEPC